MLTFAFGDKLTITFEGLQWSGFFMFNLQAPCVLYIGQAFRYSQENASYIFNQQIYFIL